MSFCGVLNCNWKVITFIIIFSIVMSVLVGFITSQARIKALQELGLKCDETLGLDNYVIISCSAGYCCTEKTSPTNLVDLSTTNFTLTKGGET